MDKRSPVLNCCHALVAKIMISEASWFSEGTGFGLQSSWEGEMERLGTYHLESSLLREQIYLYFGNKGFTVHWPLPVAWRCGGREGQSGLVSVPGASQMTGQTPGLPIMCAPN